MTVAPMKKRCSSCGKTKKLTEFSFNRSRPDGHQTACKQCFSEKYSPASYSPKRRRARHIKKAYGVEWEQYKGQFEKQGGKCAICRVELMILGNKDKNGACVDHDHSTGEFRGLLCQDCNSGLGHFKDNVQSLIAAANYLDVAQKFKHKNK